MRALTLAVSLILISTVASGQAIDYVQNVTIRVGESMVIHGARGECGQAAPSWDRVAARLPAVALGTFSDGGIGTRSSRSCGGPTPARAVRFTATQTGGTQIELFGDPVTITVLP